MSIASFIINRLPWGRVTQRLIRIRKYRSKDDLVLKSYENFWWTIFYRSTNHYNDAPLLKGDFLNVYNIKIPRPVSNKDWQMFWSEFPDLLLPWKIETEGHKFQFKDIDYFLDEGPYELNNYVSVKSGDVVFDCGANMGIFSAICSNRGADVYAFEPSKLVIKRYLNKTVKLNGNIYICPYAIGEKDGIASFETNLDSMSSSKITNSVDAEKVKLVSLDSFAEKNGINRVDFIKSDIEGAERDMLRGAKRILKEMAPKLAICTYHLPDDKEVLEKIVLEANPKYKIVYRYKKMYAYVPAQS